MGFRIKMLKVQGLFDKSDNVALLETINVDITFRKI